MAMTSMTSLHLSYLQNDMGDNGSHGETEYRLVTSAVLDRESNAEYHLQVTCHDSAADGKARTSTETLTVDVADVNDNDPVFSQTVYHAELIENNYVGAVVFTVCTAIHLRVSPPPR